MKLTNITKLSLPRLMLHLEGLAVLIASLAIYANQNFGALTFILLILAPDLSMLGYLVNKRIGSYSYNTVHFYALPIVLLVLGITINWSLGIQLGLIWSAHIGMDRMLGYGLKYPAAFKETHMQRL